MEIIGYCVLLAGLVAVVLATLTLRSLRARLAELAADADEVADRVHALPPDLVDYLGEGDRLVLTAELLNPVELAAEKTWVAKPMSAITPNLLRELVYKQAVTQVDKQLSQLNIEADVQVHRGR
ncbi:hypothetical protein H0B56_01010 [Haloechinothrix sp. YIM 98757]|uniref:Uncharacterized protein n=1 Tax=Haloechinothrix aidingensis TaxID=2752311 RepID=A0A838A577_9PSEU|nr:hypothetical protein [Haloechinothrix aidingensis]MBA0124118.1 hypothetical protein [Haloechinothrix aidingensis]